MTEYRGYRIIPAKNMMGYELQHIGRGSIHKSLSGYFTSIKIAKELIDYYLNSKEEGKEEEGGETDASSGNQQIQRRSYNRRESSNKS